MATLPKPNPGGSFTKISVSLPRELFKKLKRLAGHPQHAGNVSSWVRLMILQTEDNLKSPAARRD